MSDPIHEKFVKLIGQVEDLEDAVAEMEKKQDDLGELAGVREKLQQARDELARVSNGCGSPRPGL